MFEPSMTGLLATLAEWTPPGPVAVAELAGCHPAGLSPGEQVDLIRAIERQAAWLAALQARALAALAAPADQDCPDLVYPDPDEWVREEVAAALRLPAVTAHERLQVAQALSHRLPVTRAALAAGVIGYRHAAAVVEAVEHLDDAAAAGVEARVLPRAGEQSVAELRRALRRAVIGVDPAGAEAAQRRAAAERTVWCQPLPDGMAELRLTGPADGVLTIHTALTAIADQAADQASDGGRPVGARRFDAAVGICQHILAAGSWAGTELPVRHRRRPHIQITVAASTLLGADEHPGELTGYGPITAGTARRIATGGTWRRLLTDPASGQLLHYGRRTYQPPADLADHLITRDQTCTFPHCHQPAHRCDIDHTRPWNHGGTTDPDNCTIVCRRHHQAKTHHGWQLTRHNHTNTWTSPAGKTYPTRPAPLNDS